MQKNIAVIRGDGIGPEIVDQALLVLDKVASLYGHTFTYTNVATGKQVSVTLEKDAVCFVEL